MFPCIGNNTLETDGFFSAITSEIPDALTMSEAELDVLLQKIQEAV